MKNKNWQPQLVKMLAQTKKASWEMGQWPEKLKNQILQEAARELEKNQAAIIRANQKDLAGARKAGLSGAMLDRLTLNQKRIQGMAAGVRQVAALPDAIGKVESSWKRPNGLRISKVIVPIGVILIIFESRPNVTVECAALCIKSGNAVLLRGGREAFYSNQALVKIFQNVIKRHDLPQASVNLIQTTDRKAVDFLLKREQDIHLVIPRGGETLIRKVARMSRIPVIKHYQGICHVYVDAKADVKKAVSIIENAKLQRPGVCNAAETLLVHKKIADRFLPAAGEKLRRGGCELRGDAETRKRLPWVTPAKAKDYGHEFLDKILAVKVVSDEDAAIEHIQNFGSGHTEAIVTQDVRAAKKFMQRVDSSSVMVNASTRFADGFEYGFGAEIGISTDKIHARGPMGLQGLTSYKYVVEGSGQIRT